MIPSIRLVNFKCFRELSLPLMPLTLLTGLNGMGKSSVIQAILLLYQSGQGKLRLNGELTRIGTAKDLHYTGALKKEIHITLDNYSFKITYENPESNIMKIKKRRRAFDSIYKLQTELKLYYLGCERIGPRVSHLIPDDRSLIGGEIGIRGEFAAQYLAENEDQEVDPKVRHPDEKSSSLSAQVNAWISEATPGTRLVTSIESSMDLVKLIVENRAERVVPEQFRPTNVGFGISYLFPVIVAGLSAKPGSLLIVENPEAHLHPRGQSKIGDFLARVALGGVQVIVETHSDHLLNGVRLAVHDGRIDPDHVAIHYFDRTVIDERFEHRVVSPRINRDGRIDQWPEGFFDEWDNALQTLLTPARISDGIDPE